MTIGKYSMDWHGILEQNTFLFKRFDPVSVLGFIYEWECRFGLFTVRKATGPMIMHDGSEGPF